MAKSSIEIACFNEESALVAIAAGADRIELCANRDVGGLTPFLETLQQIKSKAQSQSLPEVPIMVMIRPRAGNFVYSADELEEMKSTIRTFKPHSSGFVFGVLTTSSTVDVPTNAGLVYDAYPLPCTFHRAFDATPDLQQALKDVSSCGFRTVLTSGGPGNAMENRSSLASLLTASGGSVTVMPGGGLRSADVGVLVRETGALWFHSSAIVGTGDEASREEILRLKGV